MRILFVDNHPEFTATVVDRFLHQHQVIVVPTIRAARELIDTSTFDVLLVDYDLDDGKGDELLRWLRTSDVKAKVVAVSARDTGNEALVAAGANRACSKIAFAKIQAVLHELVDDSAASQHAAPGSDTDGPAES